MKGRFHLVSRGHTKIWARGHEGTPALMARGYAKNLGTRARGHEGTPTQKARRHAEELGTRARDNQRARKARWARNLTDSKIFATILL